MAIDWQIQTAVFRTDDVLRSARVDELLCEYCNAPLVEIDPYVEARCSICGAYHGYDDDDNMWFGV